MAYKTVEIPGYGDVDFPDSMSDEDISAAIQKDIIKKAPTDIGTPATPEPEAVSVIPQDLALTAFGPKLTGRQSFHEREARKRLDLKDEEIARFLNPSRPDAVTQQDIETQRAADRRLTGTDHPIERAAPVEAPNLMPTPRALSDVTSVAHPAPKEPTTPEPPAVSPGPAAPSSTAVPLTPPVNAPEAQQPTLEYDPGLMEMLGTTGRQFAHGATAGAVGAPAEGEKGVAGPFAEMAGNLVGIGVSEAVAPMIGPALFGAITDAKAQIDANGGEIKDLNAARAIVNGAFTAAMLKVPLVLGRNTLEKAVTGAGLGTGFSLSNVMADQLVSQGKIDFNAPEWKEQYEQAIKFGVPMGMAAALGSHAKVPEVVQRSVEPKAEAPMLAEAPAAAPEIPPTLPEKPPEISPIRAPEAPAVAETPAAAAPIVEGAARNLNAKMPREISGAKSRYNIGRDSYIPQFESDVDKALFITSQKNKSQADQKYRDYLTDVVGLTDAEIDDLGPKLRSQIKELAKGSEPGDLPIPAFAALMLKPKGIAKTPPIEEPITVRDEVPPPGVKIPEQPAAAVPREIPQKNYLGPLSNHTPALYRETNFAGLDEMLPNSKTTVSSPMGHKEIYLTDNPDIALGQGENKGVLLEFDSAPLQGRINTSKPGWEFGYKNGSAEYIGKSPQSDYQTALRKITIDPSAPSGSKRYQTRVQGLLDDLEKDGWKKTVQDDGKITYERQALPLEEAPKDLNEPPAAKAPPTQTEPAVEKTPAEPALPTPATSPEAPKSIEEPVALERPKASPSTPFGETPDGIVAAPEPNERPTGARKALTSLDRAELGLDELPSPERKSWREALDKAREDGVPEEADRLATEIIKNPRAMTEVETAGAVLRLQQLKNQYNAAHQRLKTLGDSILIDEQARAAADIREQIETVSRAIQMTGTEKGRNLAMQKFAIDKNYDLATIETRAKASKRNDLTNEERKRLSDVTDKLAAAEKEIETLNAKAKDVQARDAIVTRRRTKKLTPQEVHVRTAELASRARGLLRAGCHLS